MPDEDPPPRRDPPPHSAPLHFVDPRSRVLRAWWDEQLDAGRRGVCAAAAAHGTAEGRYDAGAGRRPGPAVGERLAGWFASLSREQRSRWPGAREDSYRWLMEQSPGARLVWLSELPAGFQQFFALDFTPEVWDIIVNRPRMRNVRFCGPP